MITRKLEIDVKKSIKYSIKYCTNKIHLSVYFYLFFRLAIKVENYFLYLVKNIQSTDYSVWMLLNVMISFFQF